GTLLQTLYRWWGEWADSVGDPDSPDTLFAFMLDASDSMGAATFLSLHGHYGTAAAVLRNVLDRAVVGCAVHLTGDHSIAERDSPFGGACDALSRLDSVKAIHATLKTAVGFGLFDQQHPEVIPPYEGGWARRLYRTLSGFAHLASRHTDGGI